MTATVVESAPTEAASSVVKRVWGAPLWAHAAVLAALLLFVVMPLVGPYWQWSADEGAALFQAQQLADGEGWLTAPAFAEVDRDNEWFPIHLSSQADNGEWAAYAKLPLFPVVLAALLELGGTTAVVTMSVLGTVVAAWASSRIAEDLRRGAGRATLWAVALGTPMLFYSYSVIAHTVGAAAVAVGALGALRWCARRRIWWLAALAVATVAAVALRNEGVVMAIAAVLVLAIVGARRRGSGAGVAAAVVALAGGLTFLVNRLWARAILLGGGGISPPSLNEESGFLASRWDGLVHTMVDARGRDLLVPAALLVAAAAVVVRLRLSSPLPVRVLSALAVLAGVASIVQDGTGLVPGLLLVCPLLVGGLLVLRTDDVRGRAGVVAGVYAVFVLGVLAAQYGVGGADEWGGRYFVLGIALVVPLAVMALHREVAAPTRSAAIPLVAAIVALSAVLAFAAVDTLQSSHDLTESVLTTVVDTAAGTDPGDGGPPVVIATTPAVARLAWRDVPDGRWMLVMEDDIVDPVRVTETFARLDVTDVDEVTVTVVPGYALPEPAGWQLVEENLTDRGFGAAVYRRSD
jgi:hypothetical protein